MFFKDSVVASVILDKRLVIQSQHAMARGAAVSYFSMDTLAGSDYFIVPTSKTSFSVSGIIKKLLLYKWFNACMPLIDLEFKNLSCYRKSIKPELEKHLKALHFTASNSSINEVFIAHNGFIFDHAISGLEDGSMDVFKYESTLIGDINTSKMLLTATGYSDDRACYSIALEHSKTADEFLGFVRPHNGFKNSKVFTRSTILQAMEKRDTIAPEYLDHVKFFLSTVVRPAFRNAGVKEEDIESLIKKLSFETANYLYNSLKVLKCR